MHKTYLNEIELQLIKGADKIVEKIGMFPAMESGHLVGFSVKRNDDLSNRFSLFDVELVFDITQWVRSLDRAMKTTMSHREPDPVYDAPYIHKDFEERTAA